MENNYILYVGMDASKGKADAAILKVVNSKIKITKKVGIIITSFGNEKLS